jgi:hypothetical protein
VTPDTLEVVIVKKLCLLNLLETSTKGESGYLMTAMVSEVPLRPSAIN